MSFKRNWFLILILIPVFAMSSCGGGGGGGDDDGNSYLGGTWTGTWVSTTDAGQGSTLVFSLIQSNLLLSGTAIMHDTAAGDMEGNVTGNISVVAGPGHISMVITTPNATQIAFAGTYTQNVITGTYTMSGDRGIFNLAR